MPHKVQGLRAPSPTYFEPEHSEAAPCSSAKLRIDTASLAAASGAERNTWRLRCLRSGLAISAHRANKGGIDGNLRALPDWQAICHNLDTAVIEDWRVEIHVPQEDVGSDTCPSLTANPRGRMFKRKATRAQHPTAVARCTMVAKRVKKAATTAAASSKGERHAQASQKKNAEVAVWEGKFRGCWDGREGPSSVCASLRKQKSTTGGVEGGMESCFV